MTNLITPDDIRFTELLLHYFSWYRERFFDGKENSKELSTLRSTAFQDKQAILQYINEHENTISSEDYALIRRMEHCILGKFILIAVKKDSIHLLHSQDTDSYILQVTPWSLEAIMHFSEMQLPRLVEAALFPSEGKIIYDLLNVIGVTFGSGFRKSIKEDTAAAKAKHGIITSLPIPISTEDVDLINLRGMMTNKDSISNNWEEIQDIIQEKPECTELYYQKLGAAYTRERRKDLKRNGIFGWFALYGWVVIAGGKTREIADSAARSLLPPEQYERLVFFEVKK